MNKIKILKFKTQNEQRTSIIFGFVDSILQTDMHRMNPLKLKVPFLQIDALCVSAPF